MDEIRQDIQRFNALQSGIENAKAAIELWKMMKMSLLKRTAFELKQII